MPDKVLTKLEIERNRNALRYIRSWLKHRNMSQRDLAIAMDCSDASVSRWLRGLMAMSVAQFEQMASIFNTRPENLMFAPGSEAIAKQYRDAAEIVAAMSPEELAAWITVGRSMTDKKA